MYTDDKFCRQIKGENVFAWAWRQILWFLVYMSQIKKVHDFPSKDKLHLVRANTHSFVIEFRHFWILSDKSSPGNGRFGRQQPECGMGEVWRVHEVEEGDTGNTEVTQGGAAKNRTMARLWGCKSED